MTMDPLERGARALAAAYNYDPDDSWSPEAYDASPTMTPPEAPGQIKAWEHYRPMAVIALRQCQHEEPLVTSEGMQEETIFEVMEGAGLVTAVYSSGETTTWALTDDGREALMQAPFP